MAPTLNGLETRAKAMGSQENFKTNHKECDESRDRDQGLKFLASAASSSALEDLYSNKNDQHEGDAGRKACR